MYKLKLIWISVTILVLGILVWPGPALADDDQVRAIAKELYCPLCQGVTLADCPLPVCQDLRDLIKQKLEAGQTKEQIFEYFREQYGDQVLAAPPTGGINLAIWLVPFVVLVLGGLWALRLIRRWSQEPEAVKTPATVSTIRPAERERLERELKRFEEG